MPRRASRASVSKTRYLIIGNSAGGIGAAEAIRHLDGEGSLTIVSEEPCLAYSRPMISEYLAGECSLDDMLYRPPHFYDQNRIQTVLGRKATSVDFAGRLVELDDGRKIAWQKLLLATGGTPIVPQVKGMDKSGVFTFTTIADAQRMKVALGPASTFVVIGGGLIGMSVTRPLVKCGATVVMVELLDRVLSTMLDAEGSRLAEDELHRNGVNLVTGQTVSEIVGRPEDERRVGGVILENGQRISCDSVVFAIGVRPRTELVTGSPIEINRGVIVDRRMATSVRNVYACGDVAESFDFVHKGNRVIPIWPNAYLGGRVAGQNMAGLASKYAGGTAMNSLNCFGLPIVSAGTVDPGDDPAYEILSTTASDGSYRKIVLKKNRVVGMIFIGDIERSGVVFGLMKDSVNVGRFKESLLARDFGLSHFPGDLRRQRLGVPPAAAALATGAISQPEEAVMAE